MRWRNMSQIITMRDGLALVMGGFQLFRLGLMIEHSFASIFFCLSQSTPCGHNCIVTTAWNLARGKPLRTPVWRITS